MVMMAVVLESGEGKLHILDAPANAYSLVKDRNT